MLRADVESWMKSKGIKQIDLIINKDDKLAVYCELKSGKLYDHTNHVINRKIDLYGYYEWKDGKHITIPFAEVK